jgi:antitoxin component HigA of HigAB toxin-antitoxin module
VSSGSYLKNRGIKGMAEHISSRRKRGVKTDVESLQEFKYVDTFQLNPQSGQRSKWLRYEVGEAVEEFRNKHANYNVFATVQLYRNKTRQEGGGEVMYAPLFFDIDSSRLLAADYEKKPAKPGLIEEGFVKASELKGLLPPALMAHVANDEIGIPLTEAMCKDINAYVDANPDLKKFVWVRNLEQSRMDAVKIIVFFMERFGLTEDEVRVYFSGSKGFHILVNPIVLGIVPDTELHRVFKLIANYLTVQLSLKSLDTGSIYGHGRMFRLVNSIHHKSGLFKVELHHDELKGDLNEVKPLSHCTP